MSRDRVAIRPRGDTEAGRRAVRERAHERGFRVFVLSDSDDPGPASDDMILTEIGDRIRTPSGETISVARVESEATLTQLVGQVTPGGTLAIEWVSDRVIPLENVVAARGRRFSLWTVAHSASEVPGALGALEHGADLVIVDVRDPGEVERLEALVEGPLPSRLEWAHLPLVSVGPAGLGDRVIVDMTSLLTPEEGLLVGSAAAFLFHVASEAKGSRFSRPRPFRVNAGAAHSYVLLADGTTRYLSELGAGDAVLVATPDGGVRSVRVGRIKIERRPMVLLTADDRGVPRTLFGQEAESVRVTTDAGPTPTTEVRPGLQVRGVRLPPARHMGQAVEEAIEER
ncbi:MAG: 3-dehydroquinate synthase II [Thermoplasmata archaeon]|nr:3-dehydroquinate synthase II [Thermoplasmata archaeon]